MFNVARIDIAGFVDFDKDRRRPGIQHSQGRGDEGRSRHEHFVAQSDLEGAQGHAQRAAARVNRQSMFDTQPSCHLVFELRDHTLVGRAVVPIE